MNKYTRLDYVKIKLSLILLLLICTTNLDGQAQVLKQKIVKTPSFKEIFYINKETKLKEGPYYKLTRAIKQDTIASGFYQNGKQIGIWNYNDRKSKLYLSYNFDSDSILFANEDLAMLDSFTVKLDDSFISTHVERPSIFLGYEFQIKEEIRDKILFEDNDIFYTGYFDEIIIASILISADGLQDSVVIEKGLNDDLDEAILKVLDEMETEWIPSKKNGVKLKSKYYVYFHFYNKENISSDILDSYLDSYQFVHIHHTLLFKAGSKPGDKLIYPVQNIIIQ